eukprot:scaffold58111_cov84-Phaeocystis_antarctica.AAC.1
MRVYLLHRLRRRSLAALPPWVSRLLDGQGACGAPHRHGPHARCRHRSAQAPAAGVGDGRSRHPGAVLAFVAECRLRDIVGSAVFRV